MEFIEGQSLQQKLDRQGALELKEILRIGRQIAAGLAAAHQQGLVHRDVKPANILLQNGVQRVQITDFGLARAADDVAITRTGEVTGTPQYMSPEQAQGHVVDARSDLFSLGSVLYAMCTGRCPFRADTTLAALRRVCDDAPRPIRDINPEIPDWLTALIERLLAKNPDDRIQTAAEVAELLERHLAYLQDPHSTPFPGTIRPAPRTRPRRRQPWWIAAGVLLAVGAMLGATEATGVTHLASTVIRVVSGEGTLVIEVDDPGVEVALDGEELSISGAGLKEIKLRPGEYQFRATKDGAPVKTELVSIHRGDRRMVSVTREGAIPAQQAGTAAPAVDRGAFVVLRPDGQTSAKFDTLADAVLGSSAGDTIEIRGNGPYVTAPVAISVPLRICAGKNYRPVIRRSTDVSVGAACLLRVNRGPLVLEGLELQDLNPAPASDKFHALVRSDGDDDIYLLNCRFLMTRARSICILSAASVSTARNCEFTVLDFPAFWRLSSPGDAEYLIDNCVCSTGTLLSVRYPIAGNVSLRLSRTTCAGHAPVFVAFDIDPTGVASPNRVRVEASRSVFCTANWLLGINVWKEAVGEMPATEQEQQLRQVFSWSDDKNLFRANWFPMIALGPANAPLGNLADWRRLWGSSTDAAQEGVIQFVGGDPVERARSHLTELSASDFRLSPDSAGYRAGPNGKDLGADVDLVGPGEAYERWKQTPEYQEWRREVSRLIGSGPASETAGTPAPASAANESAADRSSQ